MHFFTSVNINYFAKARVLAKSIKKHCVNAKFSLVFSDNIPPEVNIRQEPFDEILTLEQLDIPVENLQLWIFLHTVVELCTAVKGQALIKFLEQGSEKVIYLDPDIVVYNSLDEIDQLLDKFDVILTPHQTIPENTKQAIIENEICSLRHGIYNFGFFAVKNSDNGLAFARWWRDRLVEFCYDDIPNGLFTDQRWGDLVPALMEGVYILKDPGYNVATWNISNRHVEQDFNRNYYLVNGIPMKFYHFSGFDSGAQKIMLELYGGNNPALLELRNWYIKETEMEGQSYFASLRSAFNYYSNGEPVEKEQRTTLRNRIDLLRYFAEANPFAVDQERSFHHWWHNVRVKELGDMNAGDYEQKWRYRSRNEVHRKYLGYKILSKITWGNLRKKYTQKRIALKKVLKSKRKLDSSFDIKIKKVLRLVRSFLTGINLQITTIVEERKIKQIIDFSNKDDILYFLHADFRKDASYNIGGVQFHVMDLAMGFRDSHNVFVAARDGQYLCVTAYIQDKTFTCRYFIGSWQSLNYQSDARLKAICARIIEKFRIHIVHVHHIYELSFDIFYVTREHNIPLFLTLHDYYYICPLVKMLDYEKKICANEDDPERCAVCLKEMKNIDAGANFIDKWRDESLRVLSFCNTIFTPSNYAKTVYESYYPSISDKIKIISHGVDPFPVLEEITPIETGSLSFHVESVNPNGSGFLHVKGWIALQGVEGKLLKVFVKTIDYRGESFIAPVELTERCDVAEKIGKKHLYSGFHAIFSLWRMSSGNAMITSLAEYNNIFYSPNESKEYHVDNQNLKSGRLNVAFIGDISLEKGGQAIFDIIKKSPEDINWFILGNVQRETALWRLERDNLIKAGWYVRDSLQTLVNLYRIDVICILPIWAETFSYTASEALLCKVPIIVTGIGALKERKEIQRCGWVAPIEASSDDLLSLIIEIADNPSKYNEKKKNLQELRLKSVSDMLSEYKNVYSGVLKPLEEK